MAFRIAARTAVLVLLLALPRAAAAGQGWELTFQAQDDDKPQSLMIKMDDEHLRVQPQGENEELILGPESIMFVDHGKKTVTEVTFTQIETILASFGGMIDQAKASQKKAMEEARKNMSEEELKAMDEQMKAAGMSLDAEDDAEDDDSDVEIKSTGETAVIAGLKAIKSEVYGDGELKGELWTTDRISFTPLQNVFDRFAKLIPESMMQDQEGKDMLDLFGELPGFPLRVVDHEEGKGEVFVVTRAEEKNFTGADWAKPEGYEPGQLPFGPMGMGGTGGDN